MARRSSGCVMNGISTYVENPSLPPAQVQKIKSQAGMPLYHRMEECVQDYLKENPYILSGYRAHYTTGMCVRSLFTLHNETVNIWTHAIGFFVFVFLSMLLFWNVMVEYETHATSDFASAHSWIYGLFSFGCLACMACSSTYHLFLCHKNEQLSRWMQRLDYYGINTIIITSFLPPLYVGFCCHPFIRTLYMVGVCLFGSVGIVVAASPVLLDSHRRVRVAIYACMSASGVIPFIHSILITPLTPESTSLFAGIALMFLLYGVGVCFYCTRFPECWYPGDFDVFLSSHQVWHVFVLAAACVHFFTCTALYQQWKISRGAC